MADKSHITTTISTIMQMLCPAFVTAAGGFLLLQFFQHIDTENTEVYFVYECLLNHLHGHSHRHIWDFRLCC